MSNPSSEAVPLEVQQEVFDLIHAYKKQMDRTKLETMYCDLSRNGCVGGPYDWQEEFHAKSADTMMRAIIAGNRCIAPWQLVETPDGPVRADSVSRGSVILSWNQATGETIPAVVSEVVRKRPESMVRVFFSNGKTLDATTQHRLRAQEGWLSVADCMRRTRDGSDLLKALHEDARRCLGRERGSRCGCRADLDFGDGQLRPFSVSGRDAAPSQDGGLRTIASVRHPIRADTPCGYSEPFQFFLDQSLRSVYPIAGIGVAQHLQTLQACKRRSSEQRIRPRSVASGCRGRCRSKLALIAPDCEDGVVSIVRYEYIGVVPVVDFVVPGTNCYVAAGVVNHNTGKTRTAAAEVAIHLTGLYPKWWRGRRYKNSIEVMVAGPTNEATRDVCQYELFGNMVEGERRPSGEGWVPERTIVDFGFRQCGVPNVLDSVKVKHVSGSLSTCSFKSYEQGPVKFQGVSRDIVWMDEEPDDDTIFTEASTRLLDRKGMLMFTRTPLFGMTPAIRRFLDGGPGIWYTTATWDNSPHIDEETRKQLLASFPDYERECRSKGIPMLGSGAIYTVPNEQITVDPMPIPDYWRRIVGIDFGIDHPTAAVWLALDPDTDVIYVYDCHRVSGQTPVYHAEAIRARGGWIPVAWPHDGDIRDKGSGKSIADHYREHGLYMLAESARYDEDRGGGQSREPVIIEMRERMLTGRLKVFRNLGDWFAEKGMYHRKDGKIVAINDDLLSATHYGVMMIRHALAKAESEQYRNRQPRGDAVEYDPHRSLKHGAA